MNFSQSIAITGIGGIFPDAPDLDRFWTNILQGVNTSREIPEGRWPVSVSEVYENKRGVLDKVCSKRACLIEDFKLKLDGLNLNPEFITNLDPMFHLALHAARDAFRDAALEQFDTKNVGVIIGNIALPTEKSSQLAMECFGKCMEEKVLKKNPSDSGSVDPINRFVAGLPAGLIARSLGLGGGGFTLDAACASSLYAMKLAVDELLAGRADAMLTGGVSRPDNLYTQMGFSQLKALSPTGIGAPFDQKGNGLVVGEGAGIFVLKRLTDALRDGDHIYACVKGIGLSNDVDSGLLAPNSEGQLRSMRQAYTIAGWSPNDVDLIECHAPGTPVGDAIEFASLSTLWGESDWDTGQCVIGSVKSNIGHLLTAAGSAGLMKVLLAMKNGRLPPTANITEPPSTIDLPNSPFRILKNDTEWKRRSENLARKAAVSAFGFGGINAHVLLEEWIPGQSDTTISPQKDKKVPVAVVGMEACFGPWNNLKSFRERVLGGGPTVAPAPNTRFRGAEESAWFKELNLNRESFKGFYINKISVPLNKYRIPPKELEEMLPQQLLMLQLASEAIEDAGLSKDERLRTGVFIGIGLDLNTTNYHMRWVMRRRAESWARSLELDLTDMQMDQWVEELRDTASPPLNANRTLGSLGSIVASRIAREYRIGGPSFTVSSEESSGMYALRTAFRMLRTGEISHAVVGAVDLTGDLRSLLGTHDKREFSGKGRFSPFDRDTDGSLAGEGAAVVVLKRLDDAINDKNRIYSVIKGIGVATGGEVANPVPNKVAYQTAMQRAYEEADRDSATIQMIETHGSGFPEEDKMESGALEDFFRNENFGPGSQALASVKADIGHTGAASGLASVVKTSICLDQEILPAFRNLKNKREELLKEENLYTPVASQYWLRNRADGLRSAGISSFSMDGNCVHLVMEAYESTEEKDQRTESRSWSSGSKVDSERLQPLGCRNEGLFIFEGDDKSELLRGVVELGKTLGAFSDDSIEELSRQWFRKTGHNPARKLGLSLVVKNKNELFNQLKRAEEIISQDSDVPFLRTGGTANLFYSANPVGTEGEIAFVYPGSGNHYAGMGREISTQWPEVLRIQDRENRYLKEQYAPQEFWNRSLTDERDYTPNATLLGQVAMGTLVTDLVRGFGIQPQAVIGYSLGETAGLFSLMAWKDRDEMLSRIKASSLFTSDLAGRHNAARKSWDLPEEKSVEWTIGVVNRAKSEVEKVIANKKRVYLMIINTQDECVIGGEREAVEDAVKSLKCHFFPVNGVTAAHCDVVKQIEKKYRDLHLFNVGATNGVRFYSGASGQSYPLSGENAADSILGHALHGIDYPRVIYRAYDDGARVFLEMGPGASCTRMIEKILNGRPYVAQAATVTGQSEVSTLLRLLARVVAERIPVDLKPLFQTRTVEKKSKKGPEKILTIPIKGLPINVSVPITKKNSGASKFQIQSRHSSLHNPAVSMLTPQSFSDIVQSISVANSATTQAHESFLRLSGTLSKTMGKNLALQMSLVEVLKDGDTYREEVSGDWFSEKNGSLPKRDEEPVKSQQIALNRDQCFQFGVGKIGDVLGSAYAEIDTYPTRVRLPDEPLMLVDRIISIHGEALSLQGGRVVTEHDIKTGAWYLDHNRIPTCIAVEAGQADLFLSGYLGIDFKTKGLAMYRLLDAVVTFHREMPGPGEVIRYDIKIDHFFRQGETYLFRFNFEATVNGELFLTMKEGCAGFFKQTELDAGRGIVTSTLEKKLYQGAISEDWEEFVPMGVESYSGVQVDALRSGDLVGCFGPLFKGLNLQNSVRLPQGKMRLFDRVPHIDPAGGRYNLGVIRTESDIHPDDWFLTCHFVDDQVMPGTLMYECCLHTLRFYLMRMGWVGEQDDLCYQPLPGVSSRLKCRGQVIASTKTAAYEISIKTIGYNPEPYAIVDALMYADDKPIVEISDMTVRISGLSLEKLHAIWGEKTDIPINIKKPAIYNNDRILAFAIGNPSEAFGDPYKIFDNGRKIARLPGPPYKFLDRITGITGEPWKMVSGGGVEAQYDIPLDAWYFESNGQAVMPFSILLEIALQPCGWLAAYIGSALTSETDLCFRNLGGSAIQFHPVHPGTGTVTVSVKITNVSQSAGMVIQHYDFEVKDSYQTVYKGNTYFGFFTKAALAQQIGIRDAKIYTPTEMEKSQTEPFDYPVNGKAINSLYPDEKMRMIDRIDCYSPNGGPHGKGFIRGLKVVNPDEWFFKAHFYQDPVCPGSLGLESYLQLLRVIAQERWQDRVKECLETVILGEKHVWSYRGQVIPADKKVTVQAVVKDIDDKKLIIRAKGFLSVDNRIIYQMDELGIEYRKLC